MNVVSCAELTVPALELAPFGAFARGLGGAAGSIRHILDLLVVVVVVIGDSVFVDVLAVVVVDVVIVDVFAIVLVERAALLVESHGA